MPAALPGGKPMDDEKWMQGAVKHPGALHAALGIPEGDKIPAGKIAAAKHSTSAHVRQMANLASVFAHHRPGAKHAFHRR